MRIAQYGTRHGHAAGKLLTLLDNPEVEFAGLFEPDAARRSALREESPYREVRFLESEDQILTDETIVAVASEGANHESLGQTQRLVEAGKHVWYDKPAGDVWDQWKKVVSVARENGLLIQMGYMFRYHDGFGRIAEWVKAGMLGEVFSLRAHMSTAAYAGDLGIKRRTEIASHHRGGIHFDLCGHMLDQVVWLLGRPQKVTSFLRSETGFVPEFTDNNLSVLEYDRALAFVDIAAMETAPPARRFEVYGTKGSAIMEPMDSAGEIRLCLQEATDGFEVGAQIVPIEVQTRQQLYELELEAFMAAIQGREPSDRTPEHELLVQETVLRSVGILL